MRKPTWEDREPQFNPIDYRGSISTLLRFFHVEDMDNELTKAWAIEYWKSQGKSTAYFDKVNPASFAQVGVLARVIGQGHDIEPNHVKFIDSMYDEISSRAKKPKAELSEDTILQKRQLKESKIDALCHEICSDIDAEIDTIYSTGVKKYDIKNHISRAQYATEVSEKIAAIYQHKLDEIKLVLDGTDKQVKESYSNFPKKTIKVLHDFLDGILAVCRASKTTARVVKKRPVSKEKQVAKVKYLNEFQPLQMTSLNPEMMVGASTLFLFNTKVNKLFHYVKAKDSQIGVKNSSLIGFDEDKSYAKTIRKPEQFFQGIKNMTSRELGKKLDELPGMKVDVGGKINADTIILKVYQ